MKLFLDTSVLLAAAGSLNGASHALFEYAKIQEWQLIASPYVLSEVSKNLRKLPVSATMEWAKLRPHIETVDDILSLSKIVVFKASKDRPVLFSALAWADILITLDKADFTDVLGGAFYGLSILSPYDFLMQERRAGRLRFK